MSADTKTRRSEIGKTVLIIGNTHKFILPKFIFELRNLLRTAKTKLRKFKSKCYSSSWLYQAVFCAISNVVVSRKRWDVNISKSIRILTSFNYECHRFDDLCFFKSMFLFIFLMIRFFFHFTLIFISTQNGNRIFPTVDIWPCVICVNCYVRAFLIRHTANECHFCNGSSAHSISLECVFLMNKYN